VAGTRIRNSDDPVTPNTRYVLESVTKMFTATMIMLEIEQGKLSLDSPLSDYFPQLPNATGITVKMLIDHRSGLPDYFDDPAIQNDLNDPRHVYTLAQVIDALLQKPQFAPNTQYAYTNSNFVVLGGILQDVSGQSVQQDLQKMITDPLGLSHTSFVAPSNDSSLFAHPYSYDDANAATDQWVPGFGLTTDTVGPVWTDGGLISTADDIAHFGDALFNGRLTSASTLEQMKDIDSDGEGLGPESSTYDGRTWLGHSGDYGGFESELWFDPTRDLTLTVTTDMDEPNSADNTTAGQIWNTVANVIDQQEPGRYACP